MLGNAWPLMKKMGWFWILFMSSPLIVWYMTNLPSTALWIYSWIAVWAWFINSKQDELTRGLGFITLSVFIAVIGKGFIGPKEHKDVIDMIQNIILLISGGVGGNFMAFYLLNTPKQSSAKERSSKRE